MVDTLHYLEQVRRLRRGLGWLLPVIVVALLAVGCGHSRRAAMRPIYMSAPPVTRVVAPAAPCPAGQDCGGAAVVSPSAAAPGIQEGEIVVSPSAPGVTDTPPRQPPASGGSGSGEPQLDPALAPTSRIQSEPRGKAATAPVTSRPVATPAPEAAAIPDPATPGSRPATPATSSTTTPAGDQENPPPPLNPPSGARVPAGTREASLPSRIEELTNDPRDLMQPPKAERGWRYVVFHHSANAAGSYAQIDREHKERLGSAGCGYHFIIGNGSDTPDGLIEVSQRWSDQKPGAHTRDSKTTDLNEYGIGICLIGDLDKQPPTDKQIHSARILAAYLKARYQIAPAHIGTHASLARVDTACPGHLFPSESILGQASPRGLATR